MFFYIFTPLSEEMIQFDENFANGLKAPASLEFVV